jgi:hypothetical protein
MSQISDSRTTKIRKFREIEDAGVSVSRITLAGTSDGRRRHPHDDGHSACSVVLTASLGDGASIPQPPHQNTLALHAILFNNSYS